MYFYVILYLLIAITGGILAIYKKDYFTRGFFISAFTGIYGVIAIYLSPESKAKTGDDQDEHNWPKYGSHALLATLITIVLGVVVYFLF